MWEKNSFFLMQLMALRFFLFTVTKKIDHENNDSDVYVCVCVKNRKHFDIF